MNDIIVMDACALIAVLANEEGAEIVRDVILKATYKVSLADSIALAEAVISNGLLMTSGHHEFDAIESAEDIKFYWIR